MTRDDIIRMARDAGLELSWEGWTSPTPDNKYPEAVTEEALERFAALVAAAEREAIAKMIEDAPELVKFATNDKGGCLVCGFTPKLAAAAIRARSKT